MRASLSKSENAFRRLARMRARAAATVFAASLEGAENSSVVPRGREATRASQSRAERRRMVPARDVRSEEEKRDV